MQNPFTLTFGKSPLEHIDRPLQVNEIIESFASKTVNQQMFIITGVRGTGKTVMMNEVAKRLKEDKEWVVIELNPSTDLLSSLLAKLNSEYVYEKMWSELSLKDRCVAKAIAQSKDGKIIEIREKLNMETNEFNPYRKRLIRKGIISGEDRGYVYFTLPLFGEYILDNY